MNSVTEIFYVLERNICVITSSGPGNAPYNLLEGGGEADLHSPLWIGLYGLHFQSYEWIGPGPEPHLRVTTPEPEPEPLPSVTTAGPESSVTARVQSLIMCPESDDTDKGIWIDIRCSDPALMTQLEALSLALGDMVTITREEEA